ncbi:hypothetical protein J7U46_20880 [Pelomonas sp. V22]|uniref:hypothetical protein n=1 Tax=Pelomonas sp. V22 TaxID=2822139 RepID=UPI0024A8A66D|nr:hypothetical protein [Pelomonas sp. V22]MDI4635531.1 hypothetical protein [Pelomonas sp. V22]
MHCLRDAPSIDLFLAQANHSDLQPLIRSRLDDLADFDDIPLSELVNIHVLAPADSLDALDQALRLSLLEAPIELCAQHTHWFELTIIVSDDGFGHVIYIPTTTEDQRLLNLCNQLAIDVRQEAS